MNDNSQLSTDPISTPSGLTTRTKRIIAIALAAGLVIVGVLFVYAMLVYPTKQPYRDAHAQYLNVKNANIALTESGANINGAGATDEQFKQNIATVKAALQSLVGENTALAKEAVLQDGEGKAVYTAFDKKLQTYAAYNEAVITSIETLRPALRLCPDGTTGEEGMTIATNEARACADALGELQLPDADYDAMAASYSDIYRQLAEKIDAGHVSEGEALVEELSDVIATFRKNLQTHQAEVDITQRAMALDEYLSNKSRIF
ncbi:MAG: hypothetical protein ACREGE_03245 [Candidatus Microsaccharimonas sp.]